MVAAMVALAMLVAAPLSVFIERAGRVLRADGPDEGQCQPMSNPSRDVRLPAK
jgi:hypothetical protein